MTAFNSTTYSIERPTGLCSFNGRHLVPGEPYMAALVEYDPETLDPQSPLPASPQGEGNTAAAALGMKRVDVSMEAWNQGCRPERLFSYWKSTVPEPNQKRKLFVDDEVLMNLFRRLGESTQPERLAFRFVLCLILMRKKLLGYEGMALKGEGTEQQEWWKMVPRGKGRASGPNQGDDDVQEVIEVLNPQLDDAGIQQVTAQLGEVLEAEL